MQSSRLGTEMCITQAEGTRRWCAHQQVAGDEELFHEGAVAAGQRRVVEADACRQQRLQGLFLHPARRILQSQHAGFSIEGSWEASHARRQQRLQDLVFHPARRVLLVDIACTVGRQGSYCPDMTDLLADRDGYECMYFVTGSDAAACSSGGLDLHLFSESHGANLQPLELSGVLHEGGGRAARCALLPFLLQLCR